MKRIMLSLTLSDKDYFRQLTKRKCCVNLHHIIHVHFTGCFRHYFKNSRFWPIYSDFKIKNSENSCKNNIFVILFKIDFKYTKRRRILMRI